jgi:hypothetical protein
MTYVGIVGELVLPKTSCLHFLLWNIINGLAESTLETVATDCL